MNKIITLFAFTIVCISIHAEAILDTTSMESLYSKQVFYSLDNGTIATVSNEDWHIAFATAGTGAAGSAILLNEATAILYACPFDTSAWNTFDTSGYKNWSRLLNSDTTWTNGAFNAYRGAASTFDMGWGILNPANNFWTFGDSLYLIQINSEFKKLWVVSLKSGVWEFRYANIDGSDLHTISFAKSTYPNRNFVYYSFIDHALMDREPDNSSWDITFQKHTDYVIPPGTYVSVSSVFANKKIWSAKSNLSDSITAMTATHPQTSFTQNISNIGREWKKFSSSTGWIVYDTIAYFLYNYDSTSFYRIVFTGFDGLTNGKTTFYKEKIVASSIRNDSNIMTAALYPNPAQNILHLLLHNVINLNSTYQILDMSGKLISSKPISLPAGVNDLEVDISDFPKGNYMIFLPTEMGIITQKFVKM